MNDKPVKHFSGIGGLAVLEGVMMRNRDKYAIAVRRSDGSITIKSANWHSLLEGSVLLRIPFVRGIFVFIDSVRLSYRAMGEAAEAPDAPAAGEEGKKKKKEQPARSPFLEDLVSGLMFLVSLALAGGLFLVLPYVLAAYLVRVIRSEALLSLFEGLLRIVIFILYVLLISCMKDIRRLFGYHGAEHKCCTNAAVPASCCSSCCAGSCCSFSSACNPYPYGCC